ncbi:spinster family MFS transporter [Bradyrhizobium sp. USDA 3311]
MQTTAAAKPSARRYYVLGLLTVIYALNFLDRTIFNVLIEPIKKEFALSDTMMGLLAGFGFALFYSLLGIPIARAADRLNRRNIVAVAFAFWSAMTALCGAASSVTSLALARIGVGIGESAGSPASQSIVADLFAKNERPRALGIYAIGTYLGVFLGYFVGGYVNQHYGWRMAFYVAGLPGILLAAILWLTISEPKRGAMQESFVPEPLGPTLRFLASQRSFIIVLIGFCLTTYTNYATAAWIPPFLARVHHLSSAEIGTYAGTFKGLAGMAGTLLGGFVVAQVSRRDDRWKLWAPRDHLRPRRSGVRAVHADAGFRDDGRDAGADLVPGRLPSRADLRYRADRGKAEHAGAGLRADRAHRHLLRPGRRPAGRRHGQRCPQRQLWCKGSYGADAVRYSLLSAAVTTTLGALLFVWAARTIRDDIGRAAA